MEKLHYSIVINAPKEKVWHTMLDKPTYKEWTNVFNPESGSDFDGDWNQGSDIRFIGPEKDGKFSGMISKIKESRPYDFLSIQHLGEIIHGEERMWPTEQTKDAQENYTFIEVPGGTEVQIDLATPAEYKDMFEGMWPKALAKLKEIAESKK